MIFYGYIFSPLIFAIPRYDLLGFSVGLLYCWSWLACMIVREVDCLTSIHVFYYLVPQYIGWTVLFLAQLLALIILMCKPCTSTLQKRISWADIFERENDTTMWHWIKEKVSHFNELAKALFVGEFRTGFGLISKLNVQCNL